MPAQLNMLKVIKNDFILAPRSNEKLHSKWTKGLIFLFFLLTLKRVILHVTGNTGQWTAADSPCVCARERRSEKERAVLWCLIALLCNSALVVFPV